MESFGRVLEDGINFKRGDNIRLLPWQRLVICNFFGIKDIKTRLRRFWWLFIEIPKKNGKSPFFGLLGNYCLAGDGVGGAQVFAAAGDKEQAKIVHNNAKQMIELDPDLSKNLVIRRDAILHPKTNSTFKVVSSDVPTKHGFNLSAVLFDELMVQPNGEFYQTLVNGVAARAEPIIGMILTAGKIKTWAEEMHKYAIKIINGEVIDNRWLAFCYRADPKTVYQTWDQEETWKMANPSYNITVPKSYFEAKVQTIKNKPSELNAFLQLHLNVWVGASTTWLMAQDWEKCNKGKENPANLTRKPVFGGLYMASVKDLVCISLYFPTLKLIKWWFFCPERTIEASRAFEDSLDYSSWEKEGYLQAIEGDANDPKPIKAKIKELVKTYDVKMIYYQRKEANQITIELNNEGIPVSPFTTTHSGISAPAKMFETMVIKKELNHEGNPIAAWQAAITNVTIKDELIKPDPDASKGNICGIIAAVMAVGAYMDSLAEPEKAESSVYNDRNIRTIKL